MAWPLSQDYNEAIQSPLVNFADPDLKHGAVATNALGIPMPCSGNFADVYQVQSPDGNRWAVKCFTRETPGLRERYQEISRHLRQAKLPFTVDFTYLEQGIRVAGKWYPVLKMQWVEGLTLNQFVRQSLDKPPVLDALLQIWVRMSKFLREAEVGHCDLQHGNILLVPGSTVKSLALKVIDYDGMWVPALAHTKSGEVGHPCYQHPQRLREATYSLEVDRFSLLLVATALRCLQSRDKTLWQKYDNGDNLLFRETDLQAPTKSVLFSELLHLDDPVARQLVQHLLKALRGGLGSVPLLDELLPVKAAAPAAMPARPNSVAPSLREGTSQPFDFVGGKEETRGPRPKKCDTSRRWALGAVGVAAFLLIGLLTGGGLAFWAMNGDSANSPYLDNHQVSPIGKKQAGKRPVANTGKPAKEKGKNGEKKGKPRDGSKPATAGPGPEKGEPGEIRRLRWEAEQGQALAQYNLGVKYAAGEGVRKDEKEAVKWYRKAAEQGHAHAQNNLGHMYANGLGVEKDEKEAVNWFRKAAEQNLAMAQHNLGRMYTKGAGVAKDEKEAVHWLRKAAAQKLATAQYSLGLMYANGQGVEKDDLEAARWLRAAADQGHTQAQKNFKELVAAGRAVEKEEKEEIQLLRKRDEEGEAAAQFNLGVRYANGMDVKKDEKEAVRWYRKAAAQNHASAQTNLGAMYANGYGVEKDDLEAVRWLRKAADQGEEIAQKNLKVLIAAGRAVEREEKEEVRQLRKRAEEGEGEAQQSLASLYDTGKGVKKDEREAARWYRKAAERGLADSMNNLGVMYDQGRGVDKDAKEAVKWFRKAALKGLALAMNNLGIMYKDGRGVMMDEEEAVKWFRKAAEQNLAEAHYYLGVMFEAGRGVPQDLNEARKWYQKGADQGSQQARERLTKLGKARPPAAKEPPRHLPVSLFQMFRSKDAPVVALALSGKGTVRLYNARGELGSLTGHTETVTCAAFTPDGTRGITGSKDRTVRVWDIGKRQSIRRLKGHTRPVTAVAISADGKTGLSADGTIVHVWELKTGREIGRLPHDFRVTCVGFTRNGAQAVCAVDTRGQDLTTPTLHVWNLSTLTRSQGLPGTAQFSAFGFDSEGTLIAGNKNGDVILVSLAKRQITVNRGVGPPDLQRISFSAGNRFVLFEAAAEVRVYSMTDGMRAVMTLVQKDQARGPYAASLDKDGAKLTYADRNPDGRVVFKSIPIP